MSKKKKLKKQNALPAPQRPEDRRFRGHDVSGALAYVRALREWGLLPNTGSKPTTDREAAALYFKLDRGNTATEDFLDDLREFAIEELDRLTNASRKPPKKAKRPADRFPSFLVLPADRYDELLHLTRWADAAPEGLELPDGLWEQVLERAFDLVDLDDSRWPDVAMDNVLIETPDTTERDIAPGTLVALLTHASDDHDVQYHCVLVRGRKS